MNEHERMRMLLATPRDLSERERQDVEAHLAHCTQCTAQAEAFKRDADKLTSFMKQRRVALARDLQAHPFRVDVTGLMEAACGREHARPTVARAASRTHTTRRSRALRVSEKRSSHEK